MAEYLEKEAVKAAFKKNFAYRQNENFANWLVRVACEIVDKVPVADVQLTDRRGRWISSGRDNDYNSYCRCSNCNHEIVMYRDSEKKPPNYCENCGFDMRD